MNPRPKSKKAPTEPTKPSTSDNVRKPLKAIGWIHGTAYPYWCEQVASYQSKWGRSLDPFLRICWYDIIMVSIDPSFLLLAVNRLTDSPTKAALPSPGINDTREMMGRTDANGNDTRLLPTSIAPLFARGLKLEPDFVLAIMPGIRALWLKGTASACWQTPTRRDYARDLRAPGGESKRAIMRGVLDDNELDDATEDTVAAASVVAPWLDFNTKDVENAKREHRKLKPLK